MMGKLWASAQLRVILLFYWAVQHFLLWAACRGETIPGRRITEGAGKSQQCHK